MNETKQTPDHLVSSGYGLQFPSSSSSSVLYLITSKRKESRDEKTQEGGASGAMSAHLCVHPCPATATARHALTSFIFKSSSHSSRPSSLLLSHVNVLCIGHVNINNYNRFSTLLPNYPETLTHIYSPSQVRTRRNICGSVKKLYCSSSEVQEIEQPSTAPPSSSKVGEKDKDQKNSSSFKLSVGTFQKRLRVADIKGGTDEGLERVGQKMTVRGWVRTCRVQKTFAFLEVFLIHFISWNCRHVILVE